MKRSEGGCRTIPRPKAAFLFILLTSSFIVDEQRVGPYAIWHHEHNFTALDGGRTEMRDLVHYVLPFGLLGNMARPFLVTPALQKIFAYREKAVRERFGG